MTILPAPVVVIGLRDARWLHEVLDDLGRRGYFDAAPSLRARAATLAEEFGEVANMRPTGGQTRIGDLGPGDDELMSYTEAARAFHVSVRTLRRRVADGSLPVVRVDGRRVRFRRTDVAEVS